MTENETNHPQTSICVRIKRDGIRCTKPVFSVKYQLCRSCYSVASRRKGLAEMKVYRPDAYTTSDKKIGRPPKPRGRQKKDKSVIEIPDVVESTDTSTEPSLAYGVFESSAFEKWEMDFIRRRKRDLEHFFEDPSSKGLAHRLVLHELNLERLRRRQREAVDKKEFGAVDKISSLLDKGEKTINTIQKELMFLPSQTMEEKKFEEVLSELHKQYQKYKAEYVVEFTPDEMALMTVKGLNISFEKGKLKEITGRLAKERARALARVLIVSFMELMIDLYQLDQKTAEDLILKLRQKCKEVVPAIEEFVD